jgi:hypothetical protein
MQQGNDGKRKKNERLQSPVPGMPQMRRGASSMKIAKASGGT